MSSIKNRMKSLIALSAKTMKEVAQKYSEITGKNLTANNLSHKLARGTLDFNDAETLADILGYKIEFIKKD